MGIVRSLVLTGVAILSAHAAVAQDSNAQQGDAPPSVQDFRLDPARDPNRATLPQRAGPEIDNRPAVALPTAPAGTASTPPPAIAPTVNPTTTSTTAPRAIRPQDRPSPPSPRNPVATPDASAMLSVSGTPLPVEQTPAQPPASPSGQDAPAAQTTGTPTETPRLWWLWIVAVLLLAGALAYLFTRRRARIVEPEAPVRPAPKPFVPTPARPGPPRAAAPPPRPRPAPAAPPPTEAAYPVSLHFMPLSARTTQAGAQIAYRLDLRNDSRVAIEGLAVAAFIANADAQQPHALAAFYDDPFAPEAHRIASIAPGATVTVEGELHLASERLTPIAIQGRSLLIPLVAFRAISLDGDDMGQGAFIVGQESTPPGARMAPFRLDQGPRQFRSIGSRPAQALRAA